MDEKQAVQFYDEYIREALISWNEAIDCAMHECDKKIEEAKIRYSNYRSNREQHRLVKFVREEAIRVSNEKQAQADIPYFQKKAEAIEIIRPYVSAEFLRKRGWI